MFYDRFDDNCKSIRSAMMEEIKIKNKSTTKSHDISDKNTTNPEAEYQTETKVEKEAGPEKEAKPTTKFYNFMKDGNSWIIYINSFKSMTSIMFLYFISNDTIKYSYVTMYSI